MNREDIRVMLEHFDSIEVEIRFLELQKETNETDEARRRTLLNRFRIMEHHFGIAETYGDLSTFRKELMKDPESVYRRMSVLRTSNSLGI